MIRVAHLIQSADSRAGGTSTAFLNILEAVGTTGDAIDLSAYFQRPPEKDPAWTAINAAPQRFHLATTTGRGLFPGDLAGVIARDLAAGKIDVLHVHGLWSPDLLAATRAARRAGVPYVWQSHGMFIRWAWNHKWLKKRAFLLAGMQRSLDASFAYILTTRGELETSIYPRTLPAERRCLIPLPVSIPADISRRPALAREGRERFGIPEGAPVLGFLGRLHHVKRVDMTIEAFAIATRKRPDMRLLLLGKGVTDEYEESLKQLAKRLGVADRVIFAGWVLGDDKVRALSAADALVLNSIGESFGYVLFESIGLGTPVLITENLALSQEFREADAGTVVANTPDALAAGMIQAATDPDRSAQAQRARQWAMQSFSHEHVGAQLLAVYRQAVEYSRRS